MVNCEQTAHFGGNILHEVTGCRDEPSRTYGHKPYWEWWDLIQTRYQDDLKSDPLAYMLEPHRIDPKFVAEALAVLAQAKDAATRGTTQAVLVAGSGLYLP